MYMYSTPINNTARRRLKANVFLGISGGFCFQNIKSHVVSFTIDYCTNSVEIN